MLHRAVAVFAFLWLTIASAAADTRVALVIGIGKYEHAPPLANPPNDAKAMADKFKALGFKVFQYIDPDFETMKEAIRNFGIVAQNSEAAVVYYAGHGVQVNFGNWLIPADANLERERDLVYEAVNLDLMLGEAASAKKVGIIILDACRNNPFAEKLNRSLVLANNERNGATRAVGSAKGLARVDRVPPNTAVGMATRADDVAEDGVGTHSPYTTALLTHMDEPGLELGLFFRNVRDTVLKATRNRQEPYFFSSLGADPFYFFPPTKVAMTVPDPRKPAAAPDDKSMEQMLKELVAKELAAQLKKMEKTSEEAARESQKDKEDAEKKAIEAAIIEAERKRAEQARQKAEDDKKRLADEAARKEADRLAQEKANKAKAEQDRVAAEKAAKDKASKEAAAKELAAKEAQRKEEERLAALKRDEERKAQDAERKRIEKEIADATAKEEEAKRKADIAAKEAEKRKADAERKELARQKVDEERKAKEVAAREAEREAAEARKREQQQAKLNPPSVNKKSVDADDMLRKSLEPPTIGETQVASRVIPSPQDIRPRPSVSPEAINGSWCGAGTKFDINRSRITFNLTQGDFAYNVSAISAQGDVIMVRWDQQGSPMVSSFTVNGDNLFWKEYNLSLVRCMPGSIAVQAPARANRIMPPP